MLKAKIYFGIIMVLFYIGIAVVFLFTNYANHLMNEERRTVFGLIVALYAAFKSFMIYKNAMAK